MPRLFPFSASDHALFASTVEQPYVITKHEDPGHGWYEVPYKLLALLDIAKDVSDFSYQRGDQVYLEEDSDATLLLKALADAHVYLNERIFQLEKDQHGQWIQGWWTKETIAPCNADAHDRYRDDARSLSRIDRHTGIADWLVPKDKAIAFVTVRYSHTNHDSFVRNLKAYKSKAA